MPQRMDLFDLETLQLRPGEGRRLESDVQLDPLMLGGERYAVPGGGVASRLDVSRTVSGYALRLQFDAPIEGACMRCMGRATQTISVEAREVDQPGESDELHSPYLDGGVLDIRAWARDALALAMPAQVACSEECRGLCPECGINLNEVDPEQHRHEAAGDPRWAKLRDLKLG
ncbi:MAG: YceD family protein [Solirubrobacterales bacterium]